MKRLLGRCLPGLLSAGCILLAASATAQSRSEEPDAAVAASLERSPIAPSAFGIAADTITSIAAWGFQPLLPDVTWEYVTGGYVSRTGGAATGFAAPLDLPSGAQIVGIELEGCDTSSGSGVELHLFVCHGPGDFCLDQLDYTVDTGTFSTVGCSYFSRTADSPLTVSNADHTYFLQVVDADTLSATRFRTARVRWRRQVRPPPGMPSFGDVSPAHPYYAFIEALFAAGITAGCGGGDYCPSRFVTRGEMAVFLTKALGLHWPD